MAVAVSGLAVSGGKAVVHFFASSTDVSEIANEDSLLLGRALDRQLREYINPEKSPQQASIRITA